MKKAFFNSIKIFIFFTFIFGIFYPLIVTLISQIFFESKANGSLIRKNNLIIGSELIAQKTTSAKYFWPRPSASDYGTLPSGASNLSLTTQKLHEAILQRKASGVTDDLLFTSASGLDPHISMNAALSQLPRVFQSRNLNENQQKQVQDLIASVKEKRQFGFLGEERINVLKLNLLMDDLLEHK